MSSPRPLRLHAALCPFLIALSLAACRPVSSGPSDGEPDDPDPPVAHPASAAHPTVIDEVRRERALVKTTRYQHRTQIDEARGDFATDCSGFVTYVVRHVSPGAVDAVPRAKKRPRAAELARHFRSLADGATGPWRAVRDARNIAAGDVIAWVKAPESTSPNTGHTVIALSQPRVVTTRADGTIELAIRVTDSTESPHANDTRAAGETGVGEGDLGLVVNAQGAPIAYSWRAGSKRTVETEFGVGRVFE